VNDLLDLLGFIKWQNFGIRPIAIAVLLGVVLLLVWQLVKVISTYRRKHQQLTLAHEQLRQYALQIGTLTAVRERNHLAHHFYRALGQSFAALHIQLQTAYKLRQINPDQAQKSLAEAYQLSSVIMREIRQTVKTLSQDSLNESS
jgi:signal transduction histidine kinase